MRLAFKVWAIAGFLALLTGTMRGDFWLTPDQCGDRLMAKGDPVAAAATYRDPARKAAALYNAAAFKEAGQTWRRLDDAESTFNRGNALIMQGLYEDAIAAYEEVLSMRPDWPPATNNLAVARARAERVKAEGGDMTGGMLAADEVVYSDQPSREGGDEEVAGEEQGPMSDQEVQALWLKRVQTKPADFLKAKFAYQLAREASPE